MANRRGYVYSMCSSTVYNLTAPIVHILGFTCVVLVVSKVKLEGTLLKRLRTGYCNLIGALVAIYSGSAHCGN
jgi:hypothetical protein